MDATVAGSISFLGAAHVSFSMTKGRNGASITDFDLSDCMMNPFKAFYTIPRCYGQRHKGHLISSLLNISVRVATSVCYILLPISINTLLTPKLIWHPFMDHNGFPRTTAMTRDLHLITPMVYVSGLSWETSRLTSSRLLGAASSSESLVAAEVFEAFHNLPSAFVYRERGWHTGTRYPNSVTVIETRPFTARGVTARAEDVQHLWQESKTYGPSYAKYAVEFWGEYNVSTPSVEVVCELNETSSAQGGIRFDPVRHVPGTARVEFGRLDSFGFDAHTCCLTTSHALFGLGAWYLPKFDGQLNASTNLAADRWANLPSGPSYALTRPPPDFVAKVHDPLISTMHAMQPSLTALAQNSISNALQAECSVDPFLCFLLQAARQLRATYPDYDTDASALSHLIAFWAQHTTTLADWTLTTDPDPTVTKSSSPSRYKVYASGPRLRWEFAILLVPAWLFAVLFTGVSLTLWRRVRLLSCTDAPGMLFVKKSASSRSRSQGVGSLHALEDLETGMYGVRIWVDEQGGVEAV